MHKKQAFNKIINKINPQGRKRKRKSGKLSVSAFSSQFIPLKEAKTPDLKKPNSENLELLELSEKQKYLESLIKGMLNKRPSFSRKEKVKNELHLASGVQRNIKLSPGKNSKVKILTKTAFQKLSNEFKTTFTSDGKTRSPHKGQFSGLQTKSDSTVNFEKFPKTNLIKSEFTGLNTSEPLKTQQSDLIKSNPIKSRHGKLIKSNPIKSRHGKLRKSNVIKTQFSGLKKSNVIKTQFSGLKKSNVIKTQFSGLKKSNVIKTQFSGLTKSSKINAMFNGLDKSGNAKIKFNGLSKSKPFKKRFDGFDASEKPNVEFVPALRKGGLVNQPTLVLAGEAGPEMIQPLNSITNSPQSSYNQPTKSVNPQEVMLSKNMSQPPRNNKNLNSDNFKINSTQNEGDNFSTASEINVSKENNTFGYSQNEFQMGMQKNPVNLEMPEQMSQRSELQAASEAVQTVSPPKNMGGAGRNQVSPAQKQTPGLGLPLTTSSGSFAKIKMEQQFLPRWRQTLG
jgi:hypothetical protein